MPGTRKDLDPLSSLVSKPEASRPAPPRAPTPAELARILAKAAVAKANAGRPGPPTAPAAPVAAPAPARPVGIAGAPPPRRTMSATEAMEAARQAEEDRASHAVAAPPARAPEPSLRAVAPPPPPIVAETPTRPPPTARTALTDPVQAILAGALAGTTLFVAGAYFAEDRKILTALWKAHRANFGARMQLDQAVACETVLIALQTAPPQRLVAAHVLSDRADFLLWVDVQNRKLLAAFPNARMLIAGLQGA